MSDQNAAAVPPAAAQPGERAEAMPDLAAFAREVVEDCCEGGLDGADIQDIARKHGVLVEVIATEPCGERCICAEVDDFPQTCYRLAPALRLPGSGAADDDDCPLADRCPNPRRAVAPAGTPPCTHLNLTATGHCPACHALVAAPAGTPGERVWIVWQSCGTGPCTCCGAPPRREPEMSTETKQAALAGTGAPAGRPGGRELDELRNEVQVAWCTQCGQWLWQRACGPTHAMRWAELRAASASTEEQIHE